MKPAFRTDQGRGVYGGDWTGEGSDIPPGEPYKHGACQLCLGWKVDEENIRDEEGELGQMAGRQPRMYGMGQPRKRGISLGTVHSPDSEFGDGFRALQPRSHTGQTRDLWSGCYPHTYYVYIRGIGRPAAR